jgi:hypothetical protein
MGQDQYVALTRTIEELHSNDDNKDWNRQLVFSAVYINLSSLFQHVLGTEIQRHSRRVDTLSMAERQVISMTIRALFHIFIGTPNV